MTALDKSPSREQSGSEALAQLRAARQWLRFLVDEFDLEPEETAFVVTASSPADATDQEMARVTLAHSLARIDACLAGAPHAA